MSEGIGLDFDFAFAGQTGIPFRNGIQHYTLMGEILQGFLEGGLTLRTLVVGYTLVQ
jgi:hypothetical protein